jgi:hypothetical protein
LSTIENRAENGVVDAETSWRSYLPEFLLLAVIVASAAAFAPLYAKLPESRKPVIEFYLQRLLPIMLGHVVLFTLAVWWRRSFQAAAAVWGVSLLVVVAMAGPIRGAAMIGAALVATLFFAAGATVRDIVLPVERRTWATALLFGAVTASAVGAWLASLHILWPLTVVGSLLLIAGWPRLSAEFRRRRALRPYKPAKHEIRSKKERRRLRKSVRASVEAVPAAPEPQLQPVVEPEVSSWRTILRQPRALVDLFSLELGFILLTLLIVWASAPELSSDVIRLYLPYVKLLDRANGFFSQPQMWSYVIPQAGVTYGETFHQIVGPVGLRYAMLVATVAAAGVIATARRFSAIGVVAALIVCSTPFVSRLSSSFMLDIFGTLTVLAIAVLVTQARTDRPSVYFAAIGAAIGVAWCAKYSTVVWAAPLGLYALWRCTRDMAFRRAFPAALVATPLGAALTATPWLVHTWRQSGNPFFPFFLKYLPSPWWPQGVIDISTLFRLPPGIRGVITAPVEFTYHTSKYIENVDGGLGLSLIILGVLGIWTLWKGDADQRAIAAAAFIGMVGICVTTAYVRYWMPTLFLLALGGAQFLRQRATRIHSVVTLAIGAIVLFAALPITLVGYWPDPKGLPLDYYTGKKSFDQSMTAQPGYEAFRDLKFLDPQYPKVLATGLDIAGHWPVNPQEVLSWEVLMHGASDTEGITRWVNLARADYWAVNRIDPAGEYFAEKVGDRFFRKELRVVSNGAVEIYALPGSARAMETLRIAQRLPHGRNLAANPSFEFVEAAMPTGWTIGPGVQVLTDAPREYETYIRVGESGSATQSINVGNAQRLRIHASMRAQDAVARDARIQVNWVAEDGSFVDAMVAVLRPTIHWQDFTVTYDVPDGAAVGVLYLTNHDPKAITDIDAVEVYATD